MKLRYAKKLSILTLLLSTLTACSSLHTSTAPVPTISQVNEVKIHHAVASLAPRANEILKKTGVPGMAIAVVQGDKIIYAQGFGNRQAGTNLPVDPDTVFLLASVSKSLASTVVAGAIGDGSGRVNWNDPVKKFLPDFTLSDPNVGKNVTIAELFSHRSGLPDHAGDILEDLGYTRAEIIQKLRFSPLHPYLSSHNYTNFGLTAAAEAVAKAENLSWEDLSKKVLYDPLQMNSTSSLWSDYNNRSNKAEIHIKDSQGNWIVSERQADEQSPAGGASSSVNDLAKWMILMNNDGNYEGRQVINKEALLKARQLPTSVSSLIPPDQQTKYYARGINVGHDATGRLHLSHSGAFAMGTATTFDLLPSEKLGIVILTNGMPIGVPETIAKEFYDIVEYGKVQQDWYSRFSTGFATMMADHGELVGKPAPTNPAPALPVSAYTGTYENSYYGPATIKAKGNDLFLVIGPKQRTFPLSHWDGNTFTFVTTGESKTGLSSLKFTLAKTNQPASMVIEFFDADNLGTFTKL